MSSTDVHPPLTYALTYVGCKVNEAELESLHGLLASLGATAAGMEKAKLAIVNTCAVTETAEKKTRKTIRRVIESAKEAHILVTGCAAALDPDAFAAFDDRVEVVMKSDLKRRVEELARALGADGEDAGERIAEERVARASAVDERVAEAHRGQPRRARRPRRFEERVRKSVIIEDGCDNACTYCVVHIARGPARSRPLGEVLAEVERLEREETPEIVLTGIDLGSYRFEGKGLADLLEVLLESTASPRFRLSSIEPQRVDEKLIDVIAQSKGRICRHLHLPLQSGSTRVLALMDRAYDAACYRELVKELRRQIDGLALSTDIIVGFPDESEEDFLATCDLVDEACFASAHLFPYSVRRGTPAATMANQIEAPVVRERLTRLREQVACTRNRDIASREGTRERAVVERIGRARTESSYLVAVSPDRAVGSFVDIRFERDLLMDMAGEDDLPADHGTMALSSV